MTPDRFHRAADLFLAAKALDSHARSAFLDGACAGDPELRRDVENLLNADAATFDLGEAAADLAPVRDALRRDFSPTAPTVTGPAPSGTEASVIPPTADLPADAIDRYRVLDLLGQGGFGTVYLAEQLEPIRRRVALKVIKLGMDTKDVIARFEAERQALALMNHPSVAKVFDAGVTKRGRPFFAMEYVPGLPITDYCDRHRLTLPQRLELFVQVCQAIQHAHHKGIIHRDIKPGNILVEGASSDQTGGGGHAALPKVIDFGIAKALGHGHTGATLRTQAGGLVGTPEYMSPEQAGAADGHAAPDIDTRTDVYSLGVLLYQLLTNSLPFTSESFRTSGYQTIVDIIQNRRPPRPSTRLLRDPEGATLSARSRRTDPRSLVREVRGDLDWITMKALEKDRGRRYDTPSALAADVRRHLSDEPILARPPSLLYLSRKFVRRNTAVVAGAGAVLSVLVLATVVSTALYLRAERDRAAAERRFAIARSIADLVLFDLSDRLMAVPGARDLHKDLLQKAAPYYVQLANERSEDIAQQRGVWVSLSDLGNAAVDLGERGAARDLLERALGLAQEASDAYPADPLFRADVGWILFRLGWVDYTGGNRAGAAALYRRSIDTLSPAAPSHPDGPGTLAKLSHVERRLGDTLAESGDADGAGACYGRSLEIENRLAAADPGKPEYQMNLSRVERRLASIALERGDTEGARRHLRRALDIRERLAAAAPNNRDNLHNLAVACEQWASLCLETADAQGAEETARRAVEICERLVEQDPGEILSRRQLAESAATLAAVLTALACPDEARSAAETALTHRHYLVQGPDAAAADLDACARLLLTVSPADLRDAAGALPLALRAVALTERKDAGYLAVLARAHHAVGDGAAAAGVQREALSLLPEARTPQRRQYEETLVTYLGSEE